MSAVRRLIVTAARRLWGSSMFWVSLAPLAATYRVWQDLPPNGWLCALCAFSAFEAGLVAGAWLERQT